MDSAERVMWRTVLLCLLAAAAGATALPRARAAEDGAAAGRIEQMQEGESFTLGDRKVVVGKLDIVPYVENDFTKRCVFDAATNPKLVKLRMEYKLDDVIAPGKDEFEKQLLLMDWCAQRFEFGDPKNQGGLRNALEILRLSKREAQFFCVQRAALLVSTSAAVGFVCRPMGHSTHSWTEMWSNQYRKWVMMDPTTNYWVEKDGVPLSAYEIRAESRKNGVANMDFLIGPDRRRRRQRESRDLFSHYTHIPNTTFLDGPPQYGRSYRTQADTRDSEAGTIPYFPINQAALSFEPDGGELKVTIRTLTPNHKGFQIRKDGDIWVDNPASFNWALHYGRNTLEARSLNAWDVAGPVSTVALDAVQAVSAVARGDAAISIPAPSYTAEGGGQVRIRTPESEVNPSYVHFWYTKGHWLEWTAEVPSAGDYAVTLRCATMFRPARELRVNGRTVTGLESFGVRPTGGWKAFKDTQLPVRVALKAGANVLRLTCLDDISLALNQISLSKAGQDDVVIRATEMSGEGGGTAQHVVSDDLGYFILWNDKGHWLEWTIDDAPAGDYDVFLQYATIYESPRELQVNGKVVEGLESFAMPLTGGWRLWVEGKLPARATLKEGRNVLRMTSLGGNGLNLTAIRLVGAGGRSILIPAIGFSAQEGGKVRVQTPPTRGSIYYWNDQGHWLEWTVDNVPAGRYEITLTYATKVRSPRELKLNGETVKGLESFTPDPTGDWQAWRRAKLPVAVELKQGKNVLCMTSRGGAGLNLEEIKLTRVQ